jgi:hypothetical protein
MRVIDKVFIDPEVRERRKKFAPYAGFNNAVKKIVNEMSTLYTQPAKRTVDNQTNATYQSIMQSMLFDVVAQHINRMFNLHRIVIVGPRIASMPDGTKKPVIDVATPSTFRLVLHPADSSMVIGHMVRVNFKFARGALPREPKWSLWTDHERVYLDEDLRPISGTWVEHGLGRSRWVTLTKRPNIPGVWPGKDGEDLIAAQVAISIANVLLLKETKSATQQAVIAGDGTRLIRGQAADSETPLEIPEGTSVTSMDLSMDTKLFIDSAEHVLETLANNYGISAALIKQQGIQSADARDLMRVPLRELRQEQQPVFRAFEKELAIVLARVIEVDGDTSQRFSPDGFAIDFGEAQTPLSQDEETNLFIKRRAASLDNTVAYMMRINPDFSREQAEAAIVTNIELETWRIEQMRAMQAASGGPTESLGMTQQAEKAAIAPLVTDAQPA